MDNNKLPHVTICVPAYNAARTIQRTLDSILAQDYPNFDVLVCDNLSSDDTAQIVKKYADKGVRYFLNPVQEKWGESNWNHALTLAEGPLIALYHADDIYTPTMVGRQVEFLQKNHQASAVFTMSQTIDEQDRPIRMGNLKLPKEYRDKELFSFPDFFNAVLKYGTITVVPTMMTRKTVIEKVGNFNWQQFCSAADIDLFLRMAQIGPIGIINEPLHLYRISSQQGSAQINKYRTHLAHFFKAIDYYLNSTKVRKLVKREALNMYSMYRSADQVLCAINLVLEDRITEASNLLGEVISWGAFLVAYHKPLQLVKLTFGVVLMATLRLGMGKIIARSGNAAYRWYQAIMRNPIKI